MGKPKKKKKRSVLSTQEQDFVNLLKMNDNPDTIGKEIIRFKVAAKDFLSTLGMKTPLDPPAQTETAKRFLTELFKNNSKDKYAYAMRTVLQGYWMAHRVIYEVTPELVEFLNSDYWLFLSKMNAARYIRAACGEPIMLDLSQLGNKDGFLCGMTSIVPLDIDADKRTYPGFINQIFIKYGDKFHFSDASTPASGVARFLEASKKLDEEVGPDNFSLMRILVYIGYLRSLVDENGRYLVLTKPCHYQVLPMAKRYDDPIPGSIPEWANSGLKMSYGYLDRDNMLQNALGQRDETGVDVSEEISEFTDSVLTAVFCQALLDWESSRMIYLMDQKSGKALIEKYGDRLGDDSFLDDLERYMPAKAFIVSYKGAVSFFVTTCKIRGESGPRVFIHQLFDENGMYLCGKGKVENPPKAIDSPLMREVLCAVKHILVTLQQREEKKLSAAPVTAKASGTTLLPGKEDGPPKPAMYEGGGIALSGPAPRIFEVTGRTVKKLSNKELVQRHGWIMTPHTRRSHAHRYWVGKGEKRHLEVRWLQDMKINACLEHGGVVSTVVRKIE